VSGSAVGEKRKMTKLLIVDDEKETREGLLQLIDWGRLKIEKVETASGGREAVRIASLYRPDIIISDIRMPDMDGLELCEKLREFLPDCQIIFISAYAEKAYLKGAIHLQAVNYVEKPIDLDELQEAVQNAVERIRIREEREENGISDEQRHMMRELLLSSIFSGHFTGNMQEEFNRVKLFENGEAYFLVLILRASADAVGKFGKEEAEEIIGSCFHKERYLTIQKDERQVIVVLGADRKDRLCENSENWELLSHRIMNPDSSFGMFCAVGSCETEKLQIQNSYQNAVIALQELFRSGYGHICFYREGRIPEGYEVYLPQIRQQEENCLNYAVQKNVDMMKTALRELYGIFSRISGWHHAFVLREYDRILRMLMEQTSQLTEEDQRNAWGKLQACDTLKEIHKFMLDMTERCLQFTEGNLLVHKVMELIERRYSEEDLSVQKLSDAVFITDSYLSRIFKQETGKTVGKYITDVRMEHAKTLLMDEGLKLYHVSMLVGYSNPSYFAKIFKRTVGIMPSEYRSRNWK